MVLEEKLKIGVALSAVCATAIGWFVTYRQNRETQLRKDRLELINRQLSGAPQQRKSPVGEGPTQGGCWLNLVACERPSRETGQGEASR